MNCLYCYIRGSKYGANLEKSLSIKQNAIEILDRQLSNRAKKNQYGIIVLSSATDPYLNIEKDLHLTRQALELILKYRFPVHILTKSDLIERDFDILHQIDKNAIIPDDLKLKLDRGVIISFSFSTLNDQVAKIFEKGAPLPSVRVLMLKKTIEEGFLCGVSLMPLLPWISDTKESLEELFSTFKKIGTHYLMPATLTLFGNERADSKILVLNAIEKHYPHLTSKYKKYFEHGTEMPLYYQRAFTKKIDELLNRFEMRNRIIS